MVTGKLRPRKPWPSADKAADEVAREEPEALVAAVRVVLEEALAAADARVVPVVLPVVPVDPAARVEGARADAVALEAAGKSKLILGQKNNSTLRPRRAAGVFFFWIPFPAVCAVTTVDILGE